MSYLLHLWIVVSLLSCSAQSVEFSRIAEARCDDCRKVTVRGRTVAISENPVVSVDVESIQHAAMGRDPTHDNRFWVGLVALTPRDGKELREAFARLEEVLVSVDGRPQFIIPAVDAGVLVLLRGSEGVVAEFFGAIGLEPQRLPDLDPTLVREKARAAMRPADDEDLREQLSQALAELGVHSWEDLRRLNQQLEQDNEELKREIEQLRSE